MAPRLGGRWIAPALPALLLALIAAGCGGDTTVPTATSPEPATSATEPAASTAEPLSADVAPPAVPEAAAEPGETGTDGAAAPEPDSADDPAGSDGRAVPDVRFDYFDGSEGSLADFAGTPTVINFWASWCPPCIVEMPAFEAVHQELRPHVAFLGLNVGDEPGAARRLATQTGVTYPLGEDPDSAIFLAFGGIGMPTTVFVDGDGMIVHMVTSRLKAQDLRGLITEHLGV